MTKTIIYIASVILCLFCVNGINFNNVFKKGHIWEARFFIIIISLIMGHLLAQFIINFGDLNIIK